MQRSSGDVWRSTGNKLLRLGYSNYLWYYEQRKMNKKSIHKTRLKTIESDYEYWLKQPISSRLAALQEIREEYIGWKYDNRPEFQRICTVIKQK